MSDSSSTSASGSFGSTLRSLRRRFGFTQKELKQAANEGHNLAGIVESALSHWERGQRVPQPPQLLAVVRVFEAKLDKEEGRSLTLRLVRLAANESSTYRSTLQGWAELDDAQMHRAFTAWAGSQTTRPARGNTVGWQSEEPEAKNEQTSTDIEAPEDTALPAATLPAAPVTQP